MKDTAESFLTIERAKKRGEHGISPAKLGSNVTVGHKMGFNRSPRSTTICAPGGRGPHEHMIA